MKVSTFDSLVPYPESATGYHLALSQNPISCDAQGVPKNKSLTVTVYRKTGASSIEIASGIFLCVTVNYGNSSKAYKNTSGTVTASLESSGSGYAKSVHISAGESSYDVSDIADQTVDIVFDGQKGDKGNIGRLPVPYGEYNSLTTYTATDTIAPYVLLAGNYYVMNKTTSVKGLNPQTDYAANGTNATWILLEHYKAIFVELLMANLGLIGKAVFYKEYMFSQYGKTGTTEVTEDGKYNIPVEAGGTFEPNLLLNFLTGYFRCTNAEITGIINALGGIFKNITASNSILKDVKINGTVSQPWARSGTYIVVGSDETITYDNIAAGATGSWGDGSVNSMLTWNLSDSGRIVRIANWKYDGETFTGVVDLSAPSGKYFFEDGISKSKLKFSREVIELIGYGDSRTFFGWIVLNRQNLMTTGRYGRKLNVLAQGLVTGTSSGASINYKSFDGGTLSVSRLGQGQYRVYFPSVWGLTAGSYIVMLSGYGYISGSTSAPIKATLTNPSNTYFNVDTSDDDSRNDGSFMFQIINLNDWL